MADFTLSSTGFRQEAAGAIDRIPPFDPRTGDHYWILPVTYQIIDPARWYDASQPDESRLLDVENVVLVAGIGCWHCEEIYTPRLASRRCKGRP